MDEINELKKLKKKNKTTNFSMPYIFNNYLAAVDKFEILDRLCRLPDDIYVVAYHRRFIRKNNRFF